MKANKRIPTDDLLAGLGYYATPIQRVVKKWTGAIGEARIQEYYPPIALAVIHRGTHLDITVAAYSHWPCVWELGQALSGIMTDTHKPEFWLLYLPLQGSTDRRFDGWFQIRDKIRQCGGPKFSEETLRQAGKRLKFSGGESPFDDINRHDKSP